MFSSNIDLLSAVARRLGPLLEDVAFVGGATVSLYATRSGLIPVRPTDDVDIIIEVASRVRYHVFSERLRQLGFHEDVEAQILCRWRVDGIVVDVMPTDTSILGFANCWYPLALATAQPFSLKPDLTIRLITSPCFLGTKIEAFLGRGQGDFLLSHDIDDLLSVMLSRNEIVEEVRNAPEELREYLGLQFREWLNDLDFVQSISGHLNPDAVSQTHQAVILERIRGIAALS